MVSYKNLNIHMGLVLKETIYFKQGKKKRYMYINRPISSKVFTALNTARERTKGGRATFNDLHLSESTYCNAETQGKLGSLFFIYVSSPGQRILKPQSQCAVYRDRAVHCMAPCTGGRFSSNRTGRLESIFVRLRISRARWVLRGANLLAEHKELVQLAWLRVLTVEAMMAKKEASREAGRSRDESKLRSKLESKPQTQAHQNKQYKAIIESS